MRRLTMVVIAALTVGLVAAACGSGDDAQPTGTETSTRAARQASVMQQDQQAQPAEPQTQDDEAADQQGQATLPADAVGEHKGVRSQRNVLGEPDAPILIEHFGDFT